MLSKDRQAISSHSTHAAGVAKCELLYCPAFMKQRDVTGYEATHKIDGLLFEIWTMWTRRPRLGPKSKGYYRCVHARVTLQACLWIHPKL